MKQLFASRTLAEWTTFSLTIDCCLTPILEVGELHQHPQIQARGLIQEKWGHRYVGTCYLEQKSAQSIRKNGSLVWRDVLDHCTRREASV